MSSVSSAQFKASVDALLDEVVDRRTPLVVRRQGGRSVVLVALDDWKEVDATTYLLSDPVQAERLLTSIAQADAGLFEEHELIEA